ncbi:radical SAM protein [Zavarzinia compransoris]|uniref:Radical SAM core domain-containing protein n=1 Tax=Zavarzinia compransoris TaxID=1264899 RepID=A0A317E5N5_9PROT|nr:radical SAM protein [Zavarzinia compransoris]PWR21981.1 hypothetical protein DKG75_08355 [Zavarzinia compransoris]TDP47281.1 MoaA/NifB/PqqE/SkfB family radical SAM enzyme [Zavarzinia compransoris]
MLSDWVETAWTRHADGSLLGRPLRPLPDVLQRLDGRRGTLPGDLSPRARQGRAIRLLAGAGYGAEGRLAGDVAMSFDPAGQRFTIAAAEARALEQRWRETPLAATPGPVPVPAGIGGKIDALPLSPALAARLRAAGQDLLAGSERRLWAGGGGALVPGALPDAVVFHDDALPVPLTLMIETTTACNFRCGFCYGRHVAQGVMKPDAFLAVLEHLPALAAVEFTGEGEPLLNRHVPDMIRAVKARGAWVHLTTNGSRMTRERAGMIVDLGIDTVATSMESLDAARFARLRPGGDLAEVQRAMALLVEERRRRGRGPDLLLWVTLLRSTLGEIDAFLDYAGSAGFARVEFQVLNGLAAYRRFYDADLAAELLTGAELRQHRDRPTTSSRTRQVIDDLLAIQAGRRCDIFMGALTVDWRGQVMPCRLLKSPQHPSAGDLGRLSLDEIWHDPGFAEFRFALQHGVVLNACDGCAYVAGA